MVKRKTRKTSKKVEPSRATRTKRQPAADLRPAAEVLMVDSAEKIPELEKLLKEGKITVVLVYADWCGACQKFKKDIWGPMCNKNAVHNRAAVRDDFVASTSLKNTKFNYLPSVLVIDEKGTPQTFEGPEGPTNAMPTPKSLTEMTNVVNVPVKPLANTASREKPIPEYLNNGQSQMQPPEYLSTSTIEPLRSPEATPEGAAYQPMQKGGGLMFQGRLLKFLRGVANGHIPISSLVPAGKRTRRIRKHKARKGTVRCRR